MSRVPPHAAPGSEGSDRPRADELEQLEELGDDAIVAHEQGAHLPQPRAQVTEEKRSVVISDHPAPGSNPPVEPQIAANSQSQTRSGREKKRSTRTEKTVVIRDRRQIEQLRREMAKRKPGAVPALTAKSPSKGVLLWVIVGVAAFVIGSLVALFSIHDDSASPASAEPAASAAPEPSAAPTASNEPPAVSIDQLPIERSKKK